MMNEEEINKLTEEHIARRNRVRNISSRRLHEIWHNIMNNEKEDTIW